MAIKIYLIVVLGISTIMILNGCGKNGLGCANTTYNFQINVRAYPDKDSIRIGDTLWFEVNAPTKLLDIGSNTTIDFSGAANLGSAIAFEKIINPSDIRNSASKFSLILLKGKQVENPKIDLIREYLFEEQNGEYKFKLGLIPKEAGVYGVIFSNATNVYRKDDKCTKAGFIINFENTNQHRYFYPNYTNGFVKGGDYYFKVY